MTIEVVPIAAAARDLPIFASWLWMKWGQFRGRPPSRTLAYVTSWTAGQDLPFGYAAYLDGLPAGIAGVVRDDLEPRPDLTPWLASVFVRPDARGRGIASALVEANADEARRRGHTTLWLHTPDQQKLYARLGWMADSQSIDLGEAVTVMRRAL
jgi:GNAT superfamily N-acetyltransferase